MTVHLHGLGHFHPENEITNRFLEELEIGTTDEWIVERVGIRSRRTALPLDYIRTTRNRDVRAAAEATLYTTAELGRRAAELAIERAGIDRGEIGMLIAGSSAPDFASPADACNVAAALGLEVPAFDVNSACTSLLVQVHLLSLMDPAKLPAFVLLVVPDSLTKTVDYTDRSAAVLWGDAAAAAVVSTRVPGRAQLLGSTLASRPSAGNKVVVPRTGHFSQEGRTVQAFAIRESARCYENLRESFESDERRLHFVGHQANLRMLESICERCGIDRERHHMNVEWFGNTGAASSASVLSMQWEKWGPRDDVAVVGVGAGLTWSSYLVRFGDAR
ncbi:MAG TPA: ketoacyl-ACP synthase III [Myxococcota bacterium]